MAGAGTEYGLMLGPLSPMGWATAGQRPEKVGLLSLLQLGLELEFELEQ